MSDELIEKLKYLGIIPTDDTRSYNVGKSNYSQHVIQPWSVWLDYPELTSWDHDIIKRVLRTKEGEDRVSDYKKIIHICQERIRQLEFTKPVSTKSIQLESPHSFQNGVNMSDYK